MKHSLTPVALAIMCCLIAPVRAQSESQQLAPVIVTAPDETPSSQSTLGAIVLDKTALPSQHTWNADTASLLQQAPGVNSQGAGGISSLPVVRGLADERLRVQVDGMDLLPACPNHMNPALSYTSPALVGSVRVFAGVTPVSVGGDNIGGTVQMDSAPLRFAQPGEGALLTGEAGTFWRSNGQAHGTDVSATLANDIFSMRYSGSTAQSDNYQAGGAFKPVASGRESGPLLPGDEIGSSAFKAHNQHLDVGWRYAQHLLQISGAWQNAPFEGFPNQRMDMTGNKNVSYNLRYSGQYAWGDLRAQAWQQTTEHRMDMGPDRHYYGTGMPMNTWARTQGASVQGNVLLSERDTLRLGAEYSQHLLYDWWPPVGASGSMAPNAFWNINAGRRHKTNFYTEWETAWNPRWISLLGVGHSQVMSDAGPVQGYNTTGAYALEAASFNSRTRQRTDRNWDVTGLLRYTPDATQTYEAGLAHKTRSPSLYQLYPWSSNSMAIGMNNFAGDGNGYLGNLQLQPEVAHTASLSGDWHDAEEKPRWGLKSTAYVTHVRNYIDANRCCNYQGNIGNSDFVMLQYANHTARLYGLDLSGHAQIASSPLWGNLAVRGKLGWVRGINTDTGDGLFSIMPLHGKLLFEHTLGRWSSALEWEGAAAKTRVSEVRNELRTSGYGLLNLRTGYAWKNLHIDAGIDNLFNRLYYPPLGGAYVGQGRSMMLNTMTWGAPVPGKGRSFNLAVRLIY